MTTNRAAYTAGLRELADILDQMPGIPLPYHGSGAPLLIMFFGGSDNRADLAAAASGIGGTWDKNGDDNYFELSQVLGGGLRVQLTAYRDQVCTRIVTGTREVTKLVKDPAAPMIEVTETVEDVEWQCSPLLAGVAQTADGYVTR